MNPLTPRIRIFFIRSNCSFWVQVVSGLESGIRAQFFRGPFGARIVDSHAGRGCACARCTRKLNHYQIPIFPTWWRRAVLNIAHRGASGTFPENTLSAFRAAIDAGADMCELGVQLSRDGSVVVIHDDSVERTTDGKGEIAELTLEDLKRLDAGAKFKGTIKTGALKGERIPTLDEVF